MQRILKPAFAQHHSYAGLESISTFCVIDIKSALLSTRRPCHIPPTKYVKMQMEYGLSALFSAVGDHSEPRSKPSSLASPAITSKMWDMVLEFSGSYFLSRGDVLSRDNERK